MDSGEQLTRREFVRDSAALLAWGAKLTMRTFAGTGSSEQAKLSPASSATLRSRTFSDRNRNRSDAT